MLEWIPGILVGLALAAVVWGAWLDMRRETLEWEVRILKRLQRLESQVGAPRPTTIPASPEALWAAGSKAWEIGYAVGSTRPGSPASPSAPTTQASLQALGLQAFRGLSHVERCSECQVRLGHRILSYKTLAQAVVDLASTSAKQAMSESVGPEPGPAISGSSASTERIKTWPLSPLTPSDAVQGVPMNDY